MYTETLIAMGAVALAIVYIIAQHVEAHKLRNLIANIGLGRVQIRVDQETKTISIKPTGDK